MAVHLGRSVVKLACTSVVKLHFTKPYMALHWLSIEITLAYTMLRYYKLNTFRTKPLVELLSYKLYMQHALQTTLLLSAIRLYVYLACFFMITFWLIWKSHKHLTLQLFQSWILTLSASPIPVIHTCTLFHYIDTAISTVHCHNHITVQMCQYSSGGRRGGGSHLVLKY